MNEKMFGLVGTITRDRVTIESGPSFEGIGGILYQAAVLCGLGKEVMLYTNLGKDMASDVEKIIGVWPTLKKTGICCVPGPGNQVHLHYPDNGERVEILESVVPPLRPGQVLNDLSHLKMLICVINSGFDIELGDWSKICRSAACPLWLDFHSLFLSPKLKRQREYLSLPEWKDWVEGVSYLQANRKEVASILGSPDRLPSEPEVLNFGRMVLELGVKTVFVTLGREGVLVMAGEKFEKIAPPVKKRLGDTTGCGDVFCGATAARLLEGEDPFTAASFGVELASKAVGIAGIEEIYALASCLKEHRTPSSCS